MPSKRERHQEQIDQLLDIIRVEDVTGTGGSVDDEEFLMWSGLRHLNACADPPSSDDIEDCITDGPDDQGLDLFYVDDDSEVVHLIQSKLRRRQSTITRANFDSLLQLPARLMDGASLRSIRNERVKEFAKHFRRCVDRGYEVRLAYLTTERTTKPIRDAASRWNSSDLAVGQHSNINHQVQIADAEWFVNTTPRDDKPTNANVILKDFFVDSQRDGSLKTLVGTMSATELIRVFDQHDFKMFRLNPRGPLGNRKVNREILNTLRDPQGRERFHILNNGLTAVCESFKEDRDSREIEIRDLQIVNGCQTTWSIYDYYADGAGSIEEVFLNIKLTEAPPADRLAGDISQASNSQNKMEDWDFIFNEKKQLDLQQQFQRLDPPMFYELKRGEYKYIDKSRLRKITIKSVAQAMYAFIGYPSEAKDRLRFVPQSVRRVDGEYNKVFFDGITAQHLVLPLLVHDRVNRRWKADPPTGYVETGTINRRLHVVWLIGELVKRAADISHFSEIDHADLKQAIELIDRWFNRAYRLANFAVDDTLSFYEKDDDDEDDITLRVPLRQLFRATRYYRRYIRYLERYLGNVVDGIEEIDACRHEMFDTT